MQQIQNKLDDAVFTVRAADDSQLGTSFAVARTEDHLYLVTCAHVVRPIRSTILVGKPRAEATVLWIADESDVADIALLRIAADRFRDPVPTLELTSEASPAVPVLTVGYRRHSDRIAKPTLHGELLDRLEIEASAGETSTIAWTAKFKGSLDVDRGFSGAPVVSLENGRIIGYIAERIPGSEHVFVFSAETIMSRLSHIEGLTISAHDPTHTQTVAPSDRTSSPTVKTSHPLTSRRWPAADTFVYLHTKERANYVTVKFVRNIPGLNDTKDHPIQIPVTRSDLPTLVDEYLREWRDALASGVSNAAKGRLESRGGELFERLLGPFRGKNRENGEWLTGFREMLAGPPKRIQIVTKDILIPWDLLFVPGVGFIGERHCVEISVASRFRAKPERRGMKLFQFDSLPFILSEQLDDVLHGHHGLIQEKLAEYRLADLRVENRLSLKRFINSVTGSPSDQLLYFAFGHNDAWRGRANANIRVGADVMDAKALGRHLQSSYFHYQPIVFLNFCAKQPSRASCQLLTTYAPFGEEFFTSGASGLIGPEIPVTPDLAVDFANSFFEELFSGFDASSIYERTMADVLFGAKQRFIARGDVRALVYSYYFVEPVIAAFTFPKFKPARRATTDAPLGDLGASVR